MIRQGHTVKGLIEILSKLDGDKEVCFYGLENNELTEHPVETILDCERVEITIALEQEGSDYIDDLDLT